MKRALLFFWEILKIVLLALIIVVPIRYFVFQPFIVKGISMEPNLHNNDYLIVDELSYHFRTPARGEVIVFKNPQNPSEKFIKRIIGLPGEEIILEANQIVIIDKFDKKTTLDESTYLDSHIGLNKKEFYLTENEYLVLGDNRLHSFDSRDWGPLLEEYIIGRAILRVFPPIAMAYFLTPSY